MLALGGVFISCIELVSAKDSFILLNFCSSGFRFLMEIRAPLGVIAVKKNVRT
jgi:hypothetical protein